jgi:hypothetical protein
MKPKRTGAPLQVYLPPRLKELLVELASRNSRKISAEVVLAIRSHLEAGGLPYDGEDSGPAAAKKTRKRKGE